MRRIFLTAVASSAMALAVPGVAAAHHGNSQGSSRSASSHHKRHHRHARIMRFGSVASAPTSGSTSTPTSPTTTTPTGESAGMITSFTNEVLTITLKDGTTVSGKVNEKTEIECAPTAPTASASSHDGGGDGGSQGGQGQLGSQQEGGQPGQDGGNDGQGQDQGDDNGEASQQRCTTAALVPGAVVGEAELSVGGAGAAWDKVQLGQ